MIDSLKSYSNIRILYSNIRICVTSCNIQTWYTYLLIKIRLKKRTNSIQCSWYVKKIIHKHIYKANAKSEHKHTLTEMMHKYEMHRITHSHRNRLTEFLVCKMAQMICALLLLDWWMLFFPVFSVVLLCPKLSHLLKTFCDCFIESCLPFSLTECVHRRFYTSKKNPINCVFGPTIKCLLHLQAIKWLATNNKKKNISKSCSITLMVSWLSLSFLVQNKTEVRLLFVLYSFKNLVRWFFQQV